MLYNPKWERSVWESTLDDLIAWLETKPRDGTYQYTHPNTCMLCQFLKDRGVRLPHVDSYGWGVIEGVHTPLPPYFDSIAMGGHWSYGAALTRARTYRNALCAT